MIKIKKLSACIFLLCVIFAQSCVSNVGEDVFQMTAEIKTIDDAGNEVSTFVQYEDFGRGNGQDGLYGTEDDDVSEYRVTVHDASIRYIKPGRDGLWFTGDDVVDVSGGLSEGFVYQKDDNLIYVNNYGPDGLPKTSDDELASYVKTIVVENAEKIIFYIGSGVDGVWMSDDDVVSHYRVNLYNDHGLLSEVKYFEVGGDGLWFSDDDLVISIEEYDYDNLNRPTKFENTLLSSPLLELPGAKLERKEIYEFEFNFIGEDMLIVKTTGKNQMYQDLDEVVFIDFIIFDSYQINSTEELNLDVIFEPHNFEAYNPFLQSYDNRLIPRLQLDGKLLDSRILNFNQYVSEAPEEEVEYWMKYQGMRFIEKKLEGNIYKSVEYYSADFNVKYNSQALKEVGGFSFPVYVNDESVDLFSLNEKKLPNYSVDAVESNEIIKLDDGISKNVYRKYLRTYYSDNFRLELSHKSTHVTVDKTIPNID